MNLYNSLRTKVYLGLILALASIPVHASSETWAQNLDLTIPSLETPSTSALDSRDKQEIMMGFECCWDQKLIEAVHQEHSLKSIESWSKEKAKRSQYTLRLELVDLPTTRDWTAFVAAQLLDIYTTHRGLKYDCVRELNPIIGARPTIPRMIAIKTTLLIPAIKHDRKNNNLTQNNIRSVNGFMTLVVLSNLDIMNRAKKYCSKR